MSGALAAEDRIDWLSARLLTDGTVAISEAAEQLAVSEMTIRRDLTELEDRGLARRVRGGARAVGPEPFATRATSYPRAKARIAAKAAPLVPAAGVVAFDASSTVMRLAGALTDARDLTVFTNGPDTFTVLQGRPGITPLLSGGWLDTRTGSLTGAVAVRSAQQLHVQRFFASCAALNPGSGACETSLDEAEVKRTIATNADEVVLVVDSSKLSHSAMAVALEWHRVDVLITELDPDDARLDPYRGMVELH